MNETQLDLLNPDKIGDLTLDEFKAIIDVLTAEDFKTLAERYPNKPRGNNYLVLLDSKRPDESQLFPFSTWQNYWSLIDHLGQKNYKIFSTRKLFNPAAKVAVAKTQDLSAADLNGAEGLKTAAAQPGVPVKLADKETGTPAKIDPPAIPNASTQNLSAINNDELISQITSAGTVDDVVKLVGDKTDKAITDAADAAIIKLNTPAKEPKAADTVKKNGTGK